MPLVLEILAHLCKCEHSPNWGLLEEGLLHALVIGQLRISLPDMAGPTLLSGLLHLEKTVEGIAKMPLTLASPQSTQELFKGYGGADDASSSR